MPGQSRTVAVLFSDIARSTDMWARESAAMAAALKTHDGLSARVLDRHEELLSKHTGDGSMGVFPSVAAALGAAIGLQREMAATEWPTTEPLRLRVGIHVGDVELRDDDAFGSTVNRAARLMSAAHPSQILVSPAVDAAARDSIDGYESRDLGPVSLRGLGETEQCFQVLAEGLESDFPDLEAAATGEIPVVHNQFIGRQRDLAAIAQALNGNRLVTLTGPGGVGKTRLALEVARLLQSSLGDAWFADLSKFRQPELVGAGIRTGLGIPDQPGVSALDVSVNHLARRRGLLVIDNCEHVLSAAGDAAGQILHGAPGVTVMTTSQERLALPEEVVWPLRPLLEEDELADAAQLFLARAEAVNPHLDLDAEMDVIRDLCRALDGMPLAIELAASRCSAMTPTQIYDRLSDRFRLLGRRRDADHRHGSLRATVDWSYELLDSDEAAVFETLAVFPAGFTLEMAEQLGSAAGVDEFGMIDILGSLVDKSLVVAETGEAPRYRYLDTLRRYALDRADSAGRQRAVAAFSEWVWRLTEDLDVQAVPEANREVPNIEAASDNLIDAGEPHRALEIVRTLENALADHYDTWQRLLKRLIAEPDDPALQSQAAAELSWTLWYGNKVEDSIAAANTAIAIAGEAGLDPPAAAFTTLALHAALNDDTSTTFGMIDRARSLADRSDDPYDEYFVEQIAVWAYIASENLEAAAAAAESALLIGRTLNRVRILALEVNSCMALRFTDPARALEIIEEGLANARRTEQHFWLASTLSHRAFTLFLAKDLEGSLRSFLEAMPHAVAVGDWRLAASAAETIARAVAREASPREAAVLLAGSIAERKRRGTATGSRIDAVAREHLQERLRPELGSDFEAAWAEGTALPEGEVFEMAMRLADELLGGESPKS